MTTDIERPDVLYGVEHLARELSIACAVKHLAGKRHGLSVEVISLTHPPGDVVGRYRPRLIVVPSAVTGTTYGQSTPLHHIPDVPVLNLALEHLLSEGNRKFRMPRDEIVREDMLHAAAGDFYRSWLEADGVPSENIVTIGSLPCTLYRSPYRAFFESRRQDVAQIHGLDPAKPWVLFPENSSAAFLTGSHIRNRIRHGYDRTALAEYVSWSHDTLQQVLAWCVEAAYLGGIELILRPRPATPRERFAQALREAVGQAPRSGLHIIKDGDVRQWVLLSQMVISSYSTVLVEAAVAGVPAYMLNPIPLPGSTRSDWHNEAQRITSQAAFLDLMRAPDTAARCQGLAAWANRHLMTHGDAIENLVQICSEIVAGRRVVPTPRPPGLASTVRETAGNQLKRTEQFVRSLLRPTRRATFSHERDAFGPDAVNAGVDRWRQVLSTVPGSRETEARSPAE